MELYLVEMTNRLRYRYAVKAESREEALRMAYAKYFYAPDDSCLIENDMDENTVTVNDSRVSKKELDDAYDNLNTKSLRKHMDKTLLGKRVHEARLKKHMSQKDLACKCYMSVSGLQGIEYGENITSLDRAYDIADVLGVDPAWLVGWKD